MKKILLGLFMAISVSAYSQIGITGYTANAVGINYKFLSRLSVDFKMITQNFDETKSHLSLNYSYVKADNYNFYVGAGLSDRAINGDLVSSIIIPIGFEVAPFESAKKLSFIVEITPNTFDLSINKFLGVRYSFGN